MAALPDKFCIKAYKEENRRLHVRFSIWQPPGEGVRVDRLLPNLGHRKVSRAFAALNDWAYRTDPDFIQRGAHIKELWAQRAPGEVAVSI